MGLARALSKLGYCSRSQAAELIQQGRVSLNGAARRDPETAVRLERDRIEVDGAPLVRVEYTYIMVNKPRGFITTASDEKGRDTVYALLGKDSPWVGPVGRLDKASEGLLLLTNDSEWAARVTDPETHMDKTYHVQVRAEASEELASKLTAGVAAGGEVLHSKGARVLRGGEKNSWYEVVLDEGKNRHIRRMFEALGIEVLRLVRVAIGPVRLGDLPKGRFRQLTVGEKAALDRAPVIQPRRNAGATPQMPR